ncbi:hypothetical protein BBK82_29780 [Lentzea guizhouensis]|uniref:DUF3152 domain-containing protein n=1 Tax=Lentzea guizhouensis TaxID=1586287 RepID=A0A1B2HPG8_9PSEU|nr:DUF3152 domain-containing protein [Lentzea guizhouensis]ANZ39614.1 hypothetical protein BBK82_29780 [Lentzea guizhouensis]
MTIGRIVVYVLAAMLAGVTIGLLRSWPSDVRLQNEVAQPPVPVIETRISVRSSPPASSPPSSSSGSPSPTTAPPLALTGPAEPRPGPELPPGEPVRAFGRGGGRSPARPPGRPRPRRDLLVEVEQGAVLPQAHQPFAAAVDQALADPRGWTASGTVAFRRVDVAEPDVRIRLTATETARATCGFELPYDTSCYVGGVVYVSAPRWFRGAESFAGDLAGYRRYVINHEIGHFLGHRHEACPADGAPAPVMMQQTFSVSNDRLAEVTAGTPQGLSVPRDGSTCVPNPWPHPEVSR